MGDCKKEAERNVKGLENLKREILSQRIRLLKNMVDQLDAETRVTAWGPEGCLAIIMEILELVKIINDDTYDTLLKRCMPKDDDNE